MTAERLVVYGDFNCPWSYLASRRADVLAGSGIGVDWRAVEHERDGDPTDPAVRRARVETVQGAMERINGLLLPGELLPYSLAGFVPNTASALTAYAAARASGHAEKARQTLFEAFWCHGVDLDDEQVVRTVLSDVVGDDRDGEDRGAAARLVDDWRTEWQSLEDEVIPVVVVAGGRPMFGVDAVTWLGDQVEHRGLVPPS